MCVSRERLEFPREPEAPGCKLSGTNVVLEAGGNVFDYPAADTDVLERARAAIALMTPEQLALTEATLMTRTDLWPLQVALTGNLGFTNGVTIEAGREVVLRDIQKGTACGCATASPGRTSRPRSRRPISCSARARTHRAPREGPPAVLRACARSDDREGRQDRRRGFARERRPDPRLQGPQGLQPLRGVLAGAPELLREDEAAASALRGRVHAQGALEGPAAGRGREGYCVTPASGDASRKAISLHSATPANAGSRGDATSIPRARTPYDPGCPLARA